jgi:hypothetical protein
MNLALASGRLPGWHMSGHLIHVRYCSTGKWVVQPDDLDPISEHWSETAAERAAVAHAAGIGDCDVVVHDRYARVRFLGGRRFRRAGHRSRSGDG